MYANGEGVTRDYGEAFRLAAEQGLAEAQGHAEALAPLPITARYVIITAAVHLGIIMSGAKVYRRMLGALLRSLIDEGEAAGDACAVEALHDCLDALEPPPAPAAGPAIGNPPRAAGLAGRPESSGPAFVVKGSKEHD